MKEVTYLYPDTQSGINNINCHIKEGETIGIIGENGAGKTTLLLALCGLIRFQGDIIIDNRRLDKKSIFSIRKKMGLLFQEPDDQLFLPSVYENVEFGIKYLSIKKRAKRINDALSFIGLQGYEQRLAHHLSIGEKKRVALASVLVLNPSIILFDEPSANLDPLSRKSIIKLLKQTEGIKLVSSHDLDLIFSLCKRILILYKGKLVFDGRSRYLKQHPALLKKYHLA